MKGGVDSVICIPSSLEGSFYKYWFKFLLQFHNLTDREIDVAASFVKFRYNLSKSVKDPVLLDRLLMSDDVKKEIREDCGITKEHFQVVLSKLRKSKVIIDNSINPKFIPNIKEENGNYKLLLLFDFESK